MTLISPSSSKKNTSVTSPLKAKSHVHHPGIGKEEVLPGIPGVRYHYTQRAQFSDQYGVEMEGNVT